MKPHIVHLIASSGLYGAEKWILALMRALDSDTFTSTLVNLSDETGHVSSVVGLARGCVLDAHDFYTGGTYNPLSIIRFSKWLKANKVDLVHGHGYKSDLIGLLSAKMAGCKVISTPHGWSQEADIKLELYEKLDRFLFRFMDYVCPLSDDLVQSISHCVNKEKIKLIMNGVDIEEVTNAPCLDDSPGDGFTVGYVGQLIERKNVPVLIRAIKVLREQGTKVSLAVVGDGPELATLETLSKSLGVEEHVHFLGYRKDAIAIMKSVNVFVLPSLLEGIPRCVMEAMVAKVPVVASNIPGNDAIVHHEKTGLLFEKMDHSDLAEKIDRMRCDDELRENMVQQGYDYVLNNFSNHRMALEYQSLYQKIL